MLIEQNKIEIPKVYTILNIIFKCINVKTNECCEQHTKLYGLS